MNSIWMSLIVLAGLIILALPLIFLLGYLKMREDKFRFAIAPLCDWQYSAAEWQKYALKYELAESPKGSAKVKITLLDIWITDEAKIWRKTLDAERQCVTDCGYANNIFKLHVQSWGMYGRGSAVHFVSQHFRLPIPTDKEREIIKIVELFKENIEKQNKKVAMVLQKP